MPVSSAATLEETLAPTTSTSLGDELAEALTPLSSTSLGDELTDALTPTSSVSLGDELEEYRYIFVDGTTFLYPVSKITRCSSLIHIFNRSKGIYVLGLKFADTVSVMSFPYTPPLESMAPLQLRETLNINIGNTVKKVVDTVEVLKDATKITSKAAKEVVSVVKAEEKMWGTGFYGMYLSAKAKGLLDTVTKGTAETPRVVETPKTAAEASKTTEKISKTDDQEKLPGTEETSFDSTRRRPPRIGFTKNEP